MLKLNKKNLLVFGLVLFGLFSLVWTTAAQETAIEDRGYANPDALISADELNEIIDRDDVVVVDNRGKVKYTASHISGAILIEKGEMKADGGMRLSKEDFEKLFSEKGIKNGDTIVVYDDQGDLYSAWLWWLAKIYGNDNVRMLDGGYQAWTEAGYDTKMFGDSLPESNYEAEDLDEDLLATKEYVLDAIEDENIIIQDTRAEEEYKGDKLLSGAERKGKIPTSIWLEWSDALDENDYFKSADELKELFAERGITDGEEVVTYCQSAVRSSHAMFTLTQLIGYENVRNYDGSWIEWSKDESLPIENGAN
ncbi:MAG: sulfurtransferase [Halanaerobium sp.]